MNGQRVEKTCAKAFTINNGANNNVLRGKKGYENRTKILAIQAIWWDRSQAVRWPVLKFLLWLLLLLPPVGCWRCGNNNGRQTPAKGILTATLRMCVETTTEYICFSFITSVLASSSIPSPSLGRLMFQSKSTCKIHEPSSSDHQHVHHSLVTRK